MSAPALFTDGKHLYAGLVQSKPGTYDTAIYQSSSIDLTSGWSQLLPGIPLDRRIGYVSGAAKELGTIVFGRVRDLTGRNEVKAFVRANDTWQDLGRTPWATGGSDASYKPFGFARLGSQKKLSIIKEVAPQETLPIER